MKKHYTVNHFSLNLPVGKGQDNVSNLLRHLASTIEAEGEPIEVQDIVFHNDVDQDGNDLPVFTVYYHPVDQR